MGRKSIQYPLSPEQEKKREILEILGQPSRFAFLALLMSQENALTFKDIERAFPHVQLATFRSRVIPPLKRLGILKSSVGGAAGRRAEYYIHPDAEPFIQELLDLLFSHTEGE